MRYGSRFVPIPPKVLPKQAPPDVSCPPFERGLYYEDVVCRWLKRCCGYRILERNYRFRNSEIDIIAKKGDCLVFFEVKARRRNTVYYPLRRIDRQKLRNLKIASCAYLRELCSDGIDLEDLAIRWDVIALFFDEDGVPLYLNHYISYLEPDCEDFRSAL